MDPLLQVILGRDADTSFADDPRSLDDPIGDLFFQAEYGMPRPGTTTAPLTVAETTKALEQLRAAIGNAAFRKRFRVLPSLAESAESYLEPNSFATEFLKGAIAGADVAMRAAVRQLVTANKDAIIAYHKRAADPTTRTGTPNSKLKSGGWTYVYDGDGELAKLFEGDVEPSILN